MMTKSPSGALSPYYYKGGYFHGIHYGSYFDDSAGLLAIMKEEETFILSSPEQRRILIDLYETQLSVDLIEKLAAHIDRIEPRIIKLAITSDIRSRRRLRRAIIKNGSLEPWQIYFGADMEAAKTWLVSD